MTDAEQLALYDAIERITGPPPDLMDGQYLEHVELCLWRDHARTWLVKQGYHLIVEECDGHPSEVDVSNDHGDYERFKSTPIDAALIAAVRWVDGQKGESNATDTES